MTTHSYCLGTSLWRWIALTIFILVAVASFEMEETATSLSHNPPLRKKRKEVLSFRRGANGSDQQVPDAAELKKLFDAFSTSTHQDMSSSRRLVDVLKLSQGKDGRRLTDEGSLSCPNPQWTQVGIDIDDNIYDDDRWRSIAVALSADGLIMAVGALTDSYGPSDGQVRVYSRNDDLPLGWTQIGQDLIGEATGDRFGQFVALSDNGEVLAVSATYNDSWGTNNGHVRVFQRDANGWSQIGEDINGEVSFDYSGDAIALSGSGDVLAIGAAENDGNGASSGHVRVYQIAPSSALGWEQIGWDLDGEESGDYFGRALDLSNIGDVVAIGASRNDGAGQSSGHVRVYKRDPSTARGWVQAGGDIDGQGSNELFGSSVALSDDGEVVAIGGIWSNGAGGSPWNTGYVKVYGRESSSTLGWGQIGSNLYGDNGYDNAGSTVHLSGNGQIVTVGADACFGGSYVRVYQRDTSTVLGWKQVGDDLDIDEDLYYPRPHAISVSLSNNGEVIAIGAPRKIGCIYDASSNVKVFEACDQNQESLSTAPTSSPTYGSPPAPPCSSGRDKLLFQMRTDNFGAEISWEVQIKKSGDFEEYFGNGYPNPNPVYGDNTVYQEEYCIPDDECYRFVIRDSGGDGLCCDRGEGGYRIKFNNEIIKQSRFKDTAYEGVRFNCD